MWSRQHSKCVECGLTESKHTGHGYCYRCYMRRYAKDPRNRAHLLAYKKDWYAQHHSQMLELSRQRREKLHFDNRRQAALERDGYRCTLCGSQEQLVVHHRDGRGRNHPNPNNELDNLQTLCNSCHITIHRPELEEARRARHAVPKLNQQGKWSLKHEACVECGTVYSKHSSKGVCAACARRRYPNYRERGNSATAGFKSPEPPPAAGPAEGEPAQK